MGYIHSFSFIKLLRYKVQNLYYEIGTYANILTYKLVSKTTYIEADGMHFDIITTWGNTRENVKWTTVRICAFPC